MYQFSITNGYAAPAYVATAELFRATIGREDVREKCAQIAASVNLARESKDPDYSKAEMDKAAALKRQLPAICWHAWYEGNKRQKKNAHDSGLVMLDLDHIENPKATFCSIFHAAVKQGLVAAHVTPSTFGLRLVFKRPEGLDIPESQQMLVTALNLRDVDLCVKDLARLSFVVPEEYWFYIDYNALFGEGVENNVLVEGVLMGEAQTSEGEAQQGNVQTSEGDARPCVSTEQTSEGDARPCVSTGCCEEKVSYPESYGNLPYSRIVEELIKLMGGAPKQGNRNNFIYRMAGNLRYICDDDAMWLEAIMPDFGEESAKFRQTVRSALKMEQMRSMPKVLGLAIEKVRERLLKEEVIDHEILDSFAETPPPMPDKLPPLIKHLIKNVPEVCQPAVANAVFPALGAHLFNVSFRLIDGTYKEPTFMCVNIAKQSSGKASINTPIDYIMEDIKRTDAINRQKEQDWKDEFIKKASNKEKPKRPEDICVQCLVSDMTNAAFVQRLKDANGHYLYTNLEELELLKQLKTNGAGDVGKIICLCFDNGIYGQERVGTQSVTANLPVRWNWNASTTVKKGQNFFSNRLVDGTLSRINFCTIFRDKTKPFIYKEYDEKYAETLKPYITKLNLASGRYVCSQALELANKLLDECQKRSALADDEVYEQLSYRAVTIAYMKAMVLYIVNDCVWDKTIARFVEWSLFYDLYVKMYYFGDQIRHEEEQENIVVKSHGNSLFYSMPIEFTREQAENIRVLAGKTKEGTINMLRVWVHRKFVTYDPITQIYTKVLKA